MVKGIASAGVVGFVMLAACGALCQNVRESLPDAPSAQVASQAQRFGGFIEEARAPLIFKATSARGFSQDEFLFADRTGSRHKDPDTIFRKYLSSSSVKRQPGYQSAGGGNLVGRATHAGSRTV